MEQQNTPTLQPTLKEICDQLEHWRKIKKTTVNLFLKNYGRQQQNLPGNIQ